MFRNLCSATSVDDSKLRPDDDVRHSGVGQWISIAKVNEALAGDDVVDFEAITIAVKIVDGDLGVGMISEEEESDVIGLEREELVGCALGCSLAWQLRFEKRHPLLWRW